MTQPPLDIKAIMRVLPHRHPFLMIDRVLKYGGEEVIALKNVSLNESFFAGHFPGEPIMPGVMIGECIAQSAAFLDGGDEHGANMTPQSERRKALLSSMNLKLHRPVVPGDQMLITTRRMKRLGKMMRVIATAAVDGKTVASAEFTVMLG